MCNSCMQELHAILAALCKNCRQFKSNACKNCTCNHSLTNATFQCHRTIDRSAHSAFRCEIQRLGEWRCSRWRLLSAVNCWHLRTMRCVFPRQRATHLGQYLHKFLLPPTGLHLTAQRLEEPRTIPGAVERKVACGNKKIQQLVCFSHHTIIVGRSRAKCWKRITYCFVTPNSK